MPKSIEFVGPEIHPGELSRVHSFTVKDDQLSRYDAIGQVLVSDALIRIHTIEPPAQYEITTAELGWPTDRNGLLKGYHGYVAGAIAVALGFEPTVGYTRDKQGATFFGPTITPNAANTSS